MQESLSIEKMPKNIKKKICSKRHLAALLTLESKTYTLGHILCESTLGAKLTFIFWDRFHGTIFAIRKYPMPIHNWHDIFTVPNKFWHEIFPMPIDNWHALCTIKMGSLAKLGKLGGLGKLGRAGPANRVPYKARLNFFLASSIVRFVRKLRTRHLVFAKQVF